MKSSELVKQLRRQASEIDAVPEFDVPDYLHQRNQGICYYYDKEKFIAAVRALRTGDKKIVGDKLQFHPKGSNLYLEIERDSICKKVREAEWKCEPLLSDEEAAIVEAASEVL